MVNDHGTIRDMSAEPTLAISRFKATCLAVLEDVRRTGRPLTVTRFGKPVARIVPPDVDASERSRVLGDYAGQAEIVGDIIGTCSATGGVGSSSEVRLLLDTHIWIWSLLVIPRSSGARTARELVVAEKRDLAFSSFDLGERCF